MKTQALMTVKQVAELLGTSRQNVYQLIRRGALPAVPRPSGETRHHLLVDRDVVLRYVDWRNSGRIRYGERCPGDVTIDEARQAIGCVESTMYRLLRDAVIASHWHGTRRYTTTDEVALYLLSRRRARGRPVTTVRYGNPDVAVFIQARMESQRFPGKVLTPLAGQPMLWWQLQRVQGLRPWHTTQVLAPDTPASHGPLKAFCLDQGHHLRIIPNVPPGDVLGRFCAALAHVPAAVWIIRLTGDCPLVDPDVIARVLVGTQRAGAVYGALAAEWPDGLDVEVIRRDILVQAHHEAVAPSDREHVTPFLWRHPQRFRPYLLPCPLDLRAQCWSVDTSTDAAMVGQVLAHCGAEASWRTVEAWIAGNPTVARWARQRARNSAYVAQCHIEHSNGVAWADVATRHADTPWHTVRYGKE